MSKSRLIYFLALLLSVVPPIIATLMYFPLWQARGSECILSGLSLVLLLIAAVPLFKMIRQKFDTPAAYTVWFIIFAAFFLLSEIADEVTVIAFCGFVSNCLSAVLFWLSKKYK